MCRVDSEFTDRTKVRPLTALLLLCLLIVNIPRLASRVSSNDGWQLLSRCLMESRRLDEYPSRCTNHGLNVLVDRRFRAAKRLDFANASATAGLGWTRMWAGDCQASEFARQIAQGKSAIVWLFAAIWLERCGEHDLALDAWRVAGAAPYYYTKGKEAEASGDIATALANYRLAVEIDPHFAQGFLQMGILLYSQNEFALASQALEMALADGPNKEAYGWLGRVYQAMGNQEKAAIAYERAADLGELWYGYIALGDLYFRRGDYSLAESWYLKAKAAFPTVWSLNIYLGDAALAGGRYGDAWAYYQSALDHIPSSPRLYYSIGNWFFAQGDFYSAISWYKAAFRNGLQPDYWFFKACARAYEQTGDCQQALWSYRSAFEVAASDTERAYINGQIQQLEQVCAEK